MPTYTNANNYPIQERGQVILANTTGAEVADILTEVTVPVATPGAYTLGETIEMGTGDTPPTGIVWENEGVLSLIEVTGTLPTEATAMIGSLSSEEQTAIPARVLTRTADTPRLSPYLSEVVVESDGSSDPQTIRLSKRVATVIISETEGTPIGIYNDATGALLCKVVGSTWLDVSHGIATLYLTFAAAGGCRIQMFTASPLVDRFKETLFLGTFGDVSLSGRSLSAPGARGIRRDGQPSESGTYPETPETVRIPSAWTASTPETFEISNESSLLPDVQPVVFPEPDKPKPRRKAKKL